MVPVCSSKMHFFFIYTYMTESLIFCVWGKELGFLHISPAICPAQLILGGDSVDTWSMLVPRQSLV